MNYDQIMTAPSIGNALHFKCSINPKINANENVFEARKAYLTLRQKLDINEF